MGLTPEQKALELDRTRVYGDPRISHRAIGYAIRGVLQNRWHHLVVPEVTEDLTALIMAAFKIIRSSRPVHQQDSFDDTHVYTDFADRFMKEIELEERYRVAVDVPVPVLHTRRDGAGHVTSRVTTRRGTPKVPGARSRVRRGRRSGK